MAPALRARAFQYAKGFAIARAALEDCLPTWPAVSCLLKQAAPA
jgi:hypothetical protein